MKAIWNRPRFIAAMTVYMAAMAAYGYSALGAAPAVRTEAGLAAQGREQAGAADAKTRGPNIRASQISRMIVLNTEGKEIGTVHDIVIDATAGTVRYAAVSYGGFLGLGDKLFAVPWSAFEFKSMDDGVRHVLVLDVQESDLKNAQGFNQDAWPDFADRDFTDKVNATYHRRRIGRAGQVEIDVQQGDVGVNVKRK